MLPELFDRATIECVLKEWFKTIADLPAGLRLAVEMARACPALAWVTSPRFMKAVYFSVHLARSALHSPVIFSPKLLRRCALQGAALRDPWLR